MLNTLLKGPNVVRSTNWAQHSSQGFTWLRNANTITEEDFELLEADYGSGNVRIGSPKNLASHLDMPDDRFSEVGYGIYVRRSP